MVVKQTTAKMRTSDYTPPPLNITDATHLSIQILSLSQSTVGEITIGHVVNLASNDIRLIDDVITITMKNWSTWCTTSIILYPTGLLCIVVTTALSIPHCGCYSHLVLHHWCICIPCHWCDSHLHTTANNADQGVSQTKASWSSRILLADLGGDLCSFFLTKM